MSKPKLTGWYPGEVKPCSDNEHIGPYKRLYYNGGVYFCWWNGSFFGCSTNSKEVAYANRNIPSGNQTLPWRGLTEPSK